MVGSIPIGWLATPTTTICFAGFCTFTYSRDRFDYRNPSIPPQPPATTPARL
jgi:hypothetical protein